MSTEIVSDICPPPEWNLTEEDIHQMVDELESYYQDFKPAFERSDQARHGWVYLKGLLSDLPRKVTERIALRFGENVRSLQHFIGQSPWSCEEHSKKRTSPCGMFAVSLQNLSIKPSPKLHWNCGKMPFKEEICPSSGWRRMNCMVIRPLFGIELPLWTSGTLPKCVAQPAFGWSDRKWVCQLGRAEAVIRRASNCAI